MSSWTRSNAGGLYISYFDILNHNSGVEYLEMIHEKKLYDDLYHECYQEKNNTVNGGMNDEQIQTSMNQIMEMPSLSK